MDDPYTFMKSLADVYFTSQNAFSEEWRGHEKCFAKVLKNESYRWINGKKLFGPILAFSAYESKIKLVKYMQCYQVFLKDLIKCLL